MVQKKLPTINNAHGSDTRNIINEIIKAVNDRGLEILSESGFLTWLEKNGIKHREEVQSFTDLPSNDSLNTVRGVFDDNKIYIKKENGWVPFQTIDISKINEVDGRLTNQYKRNFLDINERSINAKNPPPPLVAAEGNYYLPDGKINPNATDDTAAIKSLIKFCEGNKYNLFFPSSGYLVNETLDGISNISISGSGINNTEIIKKNGKKNSRGIDAVIEFYQKNNFEFKNIKLQGNKRTAAEGGIATTDGLHIEGCSYFDVNNVKGVNCKNPFVSQTNWCCTFYRPVGQTSSSYAFTVRNSSTSQVWIQPTAWGTGGEFDIRSSVYLTIISPSCDHSDAGGRIDDPFLPNGSGGDYKNPSYIFRISGSNVTIISPGTENSYSKYMYLEGSQVTLLNPYVWKLENYAETYSFIETRGTARSNLFMTNPDFRNVENKVSPKWDIRGIFIERPEVQNITVNKAILIDSTFGDYKYVGLSGVTFLGAKELVPNADFILGFSAENSPFLPFNKGAFEDGQQRIVINNGKRFLKFDKGNSLVTSGDDFNMKFRMPLIAKKNPSNLLLNWLGSYSTGGSTSPKVEIRKATNLNSDGSLVHKINLKDNTLNFNTIIQIEKSSSEIFYLEVTLSTGLSVIDFEKIEILEI